MSISFIGTSIVSVDTNGTTCNYTTPTGAAAGDHLIACITIYDDLGCTITPPSGWTLLPDSRIDHPNGGDDDLTTAIYYLVAPGPPAATYSFSIAPGTFTTGIYIVSCCARGVGSFDTGAGGATTNAGFQGTVSATALTTSGANETIVAFFSPDETGITVGPSTYTTLFQNATGVPPSGFAFFGLYEVLQPAAGSTGTPTVTVTPGFTDWTAILFALVPASTPVATSVIFYSMEF